MNSLTQLPFELQVILFVMAAYLVSELVSLLSLGTGLTRALCGFVRRKINRSFDILLTPPLRTALASGQLAVGSVVVAGRNSEWDGQTIVRFAIPLEQLEQQPGTLFRVLGIGRRHLELIPEARAS